MLVLPQSLVQQSALDCLTKLGSALRAETGPVVVVDAAPLKQFDSTALAVLLELRRRVNAAQLSFVVQAMPTRLGDLARLYGIDVLLTPPDGCQP